MNLPHPHFNLPELRPLDSKTRALVWSECIHPETLRPGNRVTSLLLFFASAALGAGIGSWLIEASWGSIVTAGLFVAIGSYFESWVWAWRYRERVQEFLSPPDSSPTGENNGVEQDADRKPNPAAS